MEVRRRSCLLLSLLACATCFQGTAGSIHAAADSQCQQLAPSPSLEKFVDKVPSPKMIRISNAEQVTVGAFQIQQKLHRDLPPTALYAYGRSTETASYPGPTLEVMQDVPSHIRWENHITDSKHMLAVDESVMWANPHSGGVPIVTHVHGAEVHSTSDGHPDAWFTAGGDHGSTYTTQNYIYPNTQPATMLWYHDHAFGITRLNVLAGLAGLYIIRSADQPPAWIPTERFEVHLVVQDKQFFSDGGINFPNVGDSPALHPQWCPEYFGDTILVNGMAWPYLEVEPRMYRFRLLNAANARVFELSMDDENLTFTQIGSDQGLLEKPQRLKTVTIAPGERVDFIVDFTAAANSEVVLRNTGQAPYPDGDPAFSPEGTRSVLKFTISTATNGSSQTEAAIPATLTEPDSLIRTRNATQWRWRTNFMVEMDDSEEHPVRSLLSNLTWTDPVTETPQKGAVEVWEFVNLTPDAHPMHIHLVQFRLLNQQAFDNTLWHDGACHLNDSTPRCFLAPPSPALANQAGPKDTILALPNHVTRVVMQWNAHDGGEFAFDASSGPGYLWHCHILDHEDNDMMRPIRVSSEGRGARRRHLSSPLGISVFLLLLLLR